MEGTVLLILSLVFVAFIVSGFLFGLKGLKKQGVRFACFFVAIILAFIFAPLLAKSIMGIKITYNGQLTSLSDILLSLLNGVEEIKELTASSPTIKTLIQNIPLMIGNVLSFTLLALLLSFLSWVIYLVFASLINRKYKEIEENTGEKPKRYRLLGGALGVVQALILCFVTFLPISGLVNIVADLQTQTVVAEVVDDESAPTAKFLNENLPQEVKDIINGYKKSPISWTGNIFNMTNNIFNGIAAVEVDGIKMYLRDEVINISKVYDNVSFLFDLELNYQSLKTLNYDKVLSALDFVFNSNILKSALPEFTKYVFDEIVTAQNIKDDTDLVNLINAIEVELESENGVVDNLKNEFVCIVKTTQLVAQSPIIDNIPQEGEEFDNEKLSNIIDALSEDNKKLFNNIVDESFDSKILNKVIVFGINKGLDYTENSLKTELNDETVQLGRIDIQDRTLVLKKAEVKSMLSSCINIIDELVFVDFEAIENDFRTLFDYNFPTLIENGGSMMNAVQNMTVFTKTNIYNNLITQLARTDYNEYMDFNVLKTNNIWLTETKMLAEAIEKLIESKAISYIDKTENGYEVKTENITKMLENLTVMSEVNGESKTLIRQIFEPIYESKAFANLINITLKNLNTVVNDLGKLIDEDVVLGDMNLENFNTEAEQEKVLSFIDNITMYVKSLDLQKLETDPFVTLLDSNITQLGSCLDLIKSLDMFADTTVDSVKQKGIFTNLVEALAKTQYNDYVNFECFVEPDLRFNEEFNNIEPAIQKIISKQIVLSNNTQMSLIEFILNNGDWDILLEQINEEDISNIFTPLMNSRIFEPLGVMVVNKINEQIKDVVGEYGGLITTIVGDLDQEEVTQIIEVLTDVIDIIEDVNADDFDISEFATGDNSEKLGELLTNLQDNANNGGVFTEAYDAMIDYVKNNEEIGDSVTELIGEYPDGQIDWQQLLRDLKNK